MYTIIELRPGESEPTTTRSAHDIDDAKHQARLAANEIAELDGLQKPVWCEAGAWHARDGMEPVGGYDIGDPDDDNPAVVIYQDA